MIKVLFIALVLAGLGWFFRISKTAITLVIGLLFALVLFIQLTLPAGNPLRLATGGSAAAWGVLVGVVAVGFFYSRIIQALKSKAKPPESARKAGFSPEEVERYARHLILREIGGAGQQKLQKARVLVIGAGGLGSPALLYLAAAGVGTIGIIDDDDVSLSNLQRQVLHTDARINMPKVFSAEIGLKAINPHLNIRPYNQRLGGQAATLFADYDLIVDGSDNFETRYLVNKACVDLGLPLISAAISQWEGQISLFHPAAGTPCYACIFPKAPADGLAPSCAEAGVMGALPGVMGAMMAGEAIKFITGAGETLKGQMIIYDALYGESRKMALKRDENCAVCGR